jgi:hypothetical protein
LKIIKLKEIVIQNLCYFMSHLYCNVDCQSVAKQRLGKQTSTIDRLFSMGSAQRPLLYRVRVRVIVTLRLAVYRPSVRLGSEPLETHGQNCFPN